MRCPWLLILLFNFVCLQFTVAQEAPSFADKVLNFPSRFTTQIQKKTDKLDEQVTHQTEKYLRKLAKQEARLKKKLFAIDSNAAKNIFPENLDQQYAEWRQQLNTVKQKGEEALVGEYMPYVDSLKNSLSFLNEHPQIGFPSKEFSANVQRSLTSLQGLQAKIQGTEQVQQLIKQRKEQIKRYLGRFTQLPQGISKTFNDYNKQLYYYNQQIKAYKETLNDPDKMLKTALGALNKIPAFTDFMKKNSMLARLFPMPGADVNNGVAQPIMGLQTREQVMTAIQEQTGMNSVNTAAIVQRNTASAQSKIDELKNKLKKAGSGGEELDMPNFKPNSQKTKSFFKRLEYGTNIQTHNSKYYPVTTDLGLSVGYKINDNNILGIGASYKIGLGTGFRHIAFSSQGVGLRSFLDLKLKGSFYASGGLEYNYQQPFNSLRQIQYLDVWQQSGLIGITKIVSLRSKVLKRSKLQLLWDFLSYQQRPQTQALKFRIGYNF